MKKDRRYFSERYISGQGVEFGALHRPLATYNQSKVHYADRYLKEELLSRFPELKPHADLIVATDIILDINCGDFSTLARQDYGFFIANHVIEHLINPMRFLEEIHKVMPLGSILYLSVPNKEYTFDKPRTLTTTAHLWREYLQNTRKLSIEHLNDFILNISKDHIESPRRAIMYFKDDKLPINPLERWRKYKLHRERSIHVHVWDQNTFDEFLTFAIAKLNLALEIIDSNRSSSDELQEMVYILKKAPKHV